MADEENVYRFNERDRMALIQLKNTVTHLEIRPYPENMTIIEKISWDLLPYVNMIEKLKRYIWDMKDHRSDLPKDVLKFFSDCFQTKKNEEEFFSVSGNSIDRAISKPSTQFERIYPMKVKRRKTTPVKEERFFQFIDDQYPVKSKEHYRLTTHTPDQIIDRYTQYCQQHNIEHIKRSTLYSKYLKDCHFHYEKTGFRCKYCEDENLDPLHRLIKEAQSSGYHELKERYELQDCNITDCILLMDWAEVELQKGESVQCLHIIIYFNRHVIPDLGHRINISYINELDQPKHNDIQVIACILDLIKRKYLDSFSSIHIFSDVGLHFHDSLMVNFWSWVSFYHIKKLCELIFFVAHHGDSPADSVGRLFDECVKKYNRNNQGNIPKDADSVIRIIKNKHPTYNIFKTSTISPETEQKKITPPTIAGIRHLHWFCFNDSSTFQGFKHLWDDELITYQVDTTNKPLFVELSNQ